MKFIKKCLIVVVSLFVILATQPTNVFAESYTVDTLQKNDFIAQDDIISFTSNFKIYDSSGPHDTNNYTANNDYFVSEVFFDGYDEKWVVYLSQPVKVIVKHDADGDGGDPATEVTGSPYLVPQDSKFSIDKSTNTLTLFGDKTYTMPNPENKFVKWSWTSNSEIYTGEQIYRAEHSNNPIMSYCGLDRTITITSALYDTQTPTSINVIVPNEVETDSDATLYVHLVDQNNNDIKDNTKQISVSKVDAAGAEVEPLSSLVFDDGYSLTIHTPSETGQIFYKFSYLTINTTIIIFVEGEENNPIIKNNAWPWLAAVNNSGCIWLQTGLVDEAASPVTYEWQESDDNGVLDAYEAITDNGGLIDGEDTNTLKNLLYGHGTWIRCKITYGDPAETVYTKGVMILETYAVDIASDDDPINDFFISNGKGAYTIDRSAPDGNYTGRFDILGLYDGCWVRTSYDQFWGMYMKKPNAGEINGTFAEIDYPPFYNVDVTEPEKIMGLDNIQDIYPRFSSYESSNVIFDVRFEDYCDVAIYTDVQIGDYDLSDYADEAAVKANLNADDSLSSIQMFAHEDFATADETTCTFLVKPVLKSVHNNATLSNVSTYSIDSYDNGNYIAINNLDYEGAVFMGQKLLFSYNTGPWIDWGDDYPDPFVYKNIGGQNRVIGMYNNDSVLSMSWANTNEISFRFGVGTAGSFGDEISFEDVGEEEEHHHSGGTWIEVPNTSASVR